MSVCSTINTFITYLEGHLENAQKRTETREKSFCKTSFHLRIDGAEKKDKNKAEMKEHKKTTGQLMEPKKGQKQGSDERMQ